MKEPARSVASGLRVGQRGLSGLLGEAECRLLSFPIDKLPF
jgi:hypothetical protein